MINNQEELNFSPYSDLYDKLIPKNHFFRQINELVDFRFIMDELQSKYTIDNGRPAENPIRMFKYLLLKCINPLSDVDLVERARYDLSYKYFLGINPEDDVIDSSSLSKFRKLRLKDSELMDMLIEKTVRIAIEKGLIEAKTIIVDATHTKSRYNSHPIREVLQEQAKRLRKAVYDLDEKTKSMMPQKNTEDSIEKEVEYCEELIKTVEEMPVVPKMPAVKERMNLLKETMEDTKEELYISKDADAKTGHKTKDTSFFGYKTHIAMTTERIICAATITSGEKPDGNELSALVEKSRKAGVEVENVVGDAAYSGKANIKLAEKKDENGNENFKLIAKLNPVITKGRRGEDSGFIYNKDADMMQCKAGELAIRKAMTGKKNHTSNPKLTYYFNVEKCRNCPFKNGCYKDGAKSKTYNISIKCDEHKNQEKFQQTDYFKQLSKERYKIEAKNNEIKNVHGYDVSIGNGIYSMKIQGACAIFVTNLKRINLLLQEKEKK